MKSNQRGTAWPYLFILLGLFALSVTAPRAWNRQRYAGPPMEVLLSEQPGDVAAAVEPVKDVCPNWMPKDVQDTATTAEPSEPRVPAAVDAASNSTNKSLDPVLVEPLREFGRRVLDPIVEFARRPTELRAIPDLFLPKTETREQVANDSTRWTLPESLFETLDRLQTQPQSAEWAARVSQLIHELHEQNGLRPTNAILEELRRATVARSLPPIDDPIVQTDLLRAGYAVARRVEIWDGVIERENWTLNNSETTTLDATAPDNRLTKCLEDLDRLTASVSAGDAWREYLLVEQLRSLSQAGDQEPKRKLAQEVLARLETHKFSPKQRQFIAKCPIVSLSGELRTWAAEPVDTARLLADLERFERTQLASDARLLASDCRWLQWSDDASSQELGERIDLHYRNANVRIAVAPVLVNRFVPQPSATNAPVRDMIQGVPVRGRSTTFTKVSVRAIPDPRRIRIGLEADGTVASDTASDAGPATFYNRAAAVYQVRKLLLIGPSGMRAWPAIADADSYYSNLTDVETDFDILPLVGPLMRNFARSQHDDAKIAARREMEAKVAARARQQLDDVAAPRLEKLTAQVDADLLEPLRRLGLEPTVLDMQTTEERLTARLRLAGNTQLAAHTPRPRAPSDSLASVQLHQSAINNLLESLDLGGRQFTVAELYVWLSGKLSRELKAPEDVPDDVVVKFAAADAVRVRCIDGHMELAIAIEKLSHGKKRWRDFVVKTKYQPVPTTLEARFVRSGGIFLEGKSLQGRAEFVLRSILSKALSVDRPWRVVPEKFATDPRIADLEITQFAVEDGWIGLAYAPKRVSSETARRPK